MFFKSDKDNPEILNETYVTNENLVKDEEILNENNLDNIWRLTIPCIGLEADIVDGTDEETLNNWIGHFETTGYTGGNVALAAHNRGYPVNYFENIKSLEFGDEIIYYYHGSVLRYSVSEMNIIKDTQVEVLENTEDNIITLITCVENEPEYRRCVVGKEI
ncbi:MAG: class D sortase [Clostridia bacterium]|nr:class D sortase [Clostridia bacterium]